MAKGMLPNVTGELEEKVVEKHMLIKLPGDRVKRKVISKKSLLYLTYFLGCEYVSLPGYGISSIKVTTLPTDILKARVLAYKVDTYKSFTAVLVGSGFRVWDGEGGKND